MARANGKISGVPACLEHPGSKVRRFGTYGVDGHKRQRWQCVWDEKAEGGEERQPHTFTEALPRKHTQDGACAECERGFSPHEGHQTPRTYSFTVKDIASALVAVGKGTTYRQAASRVRNRSGRLWTSPLGHPVASPHASIVCDWVEVYGPVVTAGHGPSSWPEVVVLDALPFRLPDFYPNGAPKRAGRQHFSVLAALGYEEGESRLWSWQAHAAHTALAWKDVLESLPGSPDHVVADADTAIAKAVRSVWPQAQLWGCQWHNRQRIKRLLVRQGLYTKKGSKPSDRREKRFTPLALAAAGAAHHPKAWDRFTAEARRYANPEVLRWIARNGPTITTEFATRPDHVPGSAGALEGHLQWLRDKLEHRSHAFRNQERTNRLLALMASHRWKRANENTYATSIRAELGVEGGFASSHQRLINDRKSDGPTLMANRHKQ